MTLRAELASVMARAAIGVAVAGLTLASAGWAPVGADEGHLQAGLAHLRAGTQAEAERDLATYRDGERDSGVRRSIDRVLPLLRRPLTDDVREYIAGTIEEAVRMKASTASARPRPSNFLSRMFPLFP